MNLYKNYKDQLPKLDTKKFLNGCDGKRSLHKTKQGNYTNSQWLLFDKYLPDSLREILDKEHNNQKNKAKIYSEKALYNSLKEEDYNCEGFIITENNLLFQNNTDEFSIVFNDQEEFMFSSLYFAFFLKYYRNLVIGVTKSCKISYLIVDGAFVGITTNCESIVRR